jgi:hypothetical protein
MQGKNQNKETGSRYFENEEEFWYLGTSLINQNWIRGN